MQRWAERFEAVNNFQPRIEGMIANWYHQGFYPTPVTELFGWLAYTTRRRLMTCCGRWRGAISGRVRRTWSWARGATSPKPSGIFHFTSA